MHKFFYSMCLIATLNSVQCQVLPFKQSVLDSIKTNEFDFNVSFAVNASQDRNSSLATNAEAALLYTTKKNYYQLILNSYTNRYEKYSLDNRFFLMFQTGIDGNDYRGIAAKSKKTAFYFEPFTFLLYDANRGINYRIQLGSDLICALRPSQKLKIKIGAGLLAEAENWQMITHEQLLEVANYSDEIKKLIFDTVGIAENGTLKKNNIRANFYGNFSLRINDAFSINGFFSLQQPFKPPYKNLPQISQFPIVTKLYPRISSDIRLTFNIWKKIDLLTQFYFQYDKGQIPQYVPNFVYNFSEGVDISF